MYKAWTLQVRVGTWYRILDENGIITSGHAQLRTWRCSMQESRVESAGGSNSAHSHQVRGWRPRPSDWRRSKDALCAAERLAYHSRFYLPGGIRGHLAGDPACECPQVAAGGGCGDRERGEGGGVSFYFLRSRKQKSRPGTRRMIFTYFYYYSNCYYCGYYCGCFLLLLSLSP